MINAVHSKATVNSKARGTEVIKLYMQTHTHTHDYKHGEDYNSDYSVHKYLISSFTLVSCFSCTE